jgi:hypothetical protein
LWLQVHSRAAAAGGSVADHYLLRDLERQATHGCAPDATRLLAQRAADAPTTSSALLVYAGLAAAVLTQPEAAQSGAVEEQLQAALFSVLQRALVCFL